MMPPRLKPGVGPIRTMEHSDFRIGGEGVTATGRWRCTDIGTRVIVAIQIGTTDSSWYNGSPFAVMEMVFDEYDLTGCFLETCAIEHETAKAD